MPMRVGGTAGCRVGSMVLRRAVMAAGATLAARRSGQRQSMSSTCTHANWWASDQNQSRVARIDQPLSFMKCGGHQQAQAPERLTQVGDSPFSLV